ncbi:MAG: hypothetical protein KDK08_03295, partial [Rhizobiaceae bacterium]|nr:hypothetical protein [Rhizobiaceae bacterium]
MTAPLLETKQRSFIAPQMAGRLSVAWLVAGGLFLLLWLAGDEVAKWAFAYPKEWFIPAAKWISLFMKWLVNEASFGIFTFTDLTRFIAAIIDLPYRFVLSL